MLVAAGYALPRELRAAAELTLASEIERLLAGAGTDPGVFAWIRATIDLARTQGYGLDLVPVCEAVTAGLIEAASKACFSLAEADAAAVEGWLQLADDLGVEVDLLRVQELVYDLATRARSGSLGAAGASVAARLGRTVNLAPQAWGAEGA